MGILCAVAGHKAVPSNVWNDGYYFSRCRHCDCELIGRGGEWRSVPRGYRIVWRPRTEEVSWIPWAPAVPDGARLTDLLNTEKESSAEDGYSWQRTPVIHRGRGSVVESFPIRAAAG